VLRLQTKTQYLLQPGAQLKHHGDQQRDEGSRSTPIDDAAGCAS